MATATLEQIVSLKLSDINLNQTGRINPVSLKRTNELADSIKANGQLQPIRVRPLATQDGKPVDGKYDIIVGRTRCAAIKVNGGKEVNAIVVDVTNEKALIQSIVENLDRENTNPLDDATNQQMLRELYGWKDKEISDVYHKSAAWVGRLKGLLDLSPKIRKFVTDGTLNASAAMELVGVDDDKALKIISDSIVEVKAKPAKKTAKGKTVAAKPAKKVAKTSKVKKAVRKVKQAKAATKPSKNGEADKTKGSSKVGMSIAEVRQYFQDLTGPGEHQTVAAFSKAMVEVISGKAIEDKATNALNKIWQVYESKAVG